MLENRAKPDAGGATEPAGEASATARSGHGGAATAGSGEKVSVIIPVLNEVARVQGLLQGLQALRRAGHEIIVADGGSTDGTREHAAPLADRLVRAVRGRAAQMNAGAAVARGDTLLFLHADTALPDNAIESMESGLAGSGRVWGRFDVRLSGTHPALSLIAFMMNRRSRWSGIATGDQAIFVRRSALEALGGFAPIPLMEDVDLSRRLRRRFGWPACVAGPVITSSRRWEDHGILRTVLLMWYLRLAYWLGAKPAWLVERYYGRSARVPRS